MGSGSGGGGGGGGGGGRSAGGPGYSIHGGGGGAKLVPRSKDEIGTVCTKLLSGPPKEYFTDIFCSKLARSLFENLVEVSVSLCLNKDWDAIEERYAVPGSDGCLVELVDAMVDAHGGGDADPRVRELCRSSLESLLIYAMGDDPVAYASSDAKASIARIDRQILIESRSSYFLRELIYQVVICESAELPAKLKSELYDHTVTRADAIVGAFENRFQSGTVSHNHLFRIIGANPDWFLNLLRKGGS